MSDRVCGEFKLIKTIGDGCFSKVKLAEHKDTGKKVALKIFDDKKLANKKESISQYLAFETSALAKVKHPNVISLAGEFGEVPYTKSDGTTKNVIQIPLEYCPRGDLFDFVAKTGAFREPYARKMFHNLLSGLEACHDTGICHRDLKPENILVSEDFALKLADFGFSTELKGHDGSGKLYTKRGTESYMAPELLMHQPYTGQVVDMFALAVILFILVNHNPPFVRAHPVNDPYYRLLCSKNHEKFWFQHSKRKPNKEWFYSDDFKALVHDMFRFDPKHRLTLEQIREHPWMKGPMVTESELRTELKVRYEKMTGTTVSMDFDNDME